MLIGRTKELRDLQQCLESPEAELVAVYGRRRVGKTFLIRRFIEQTDCIAFQFTGIQGAKLKTQLLEFTKELEIFYQKLGISVELKPPESWMDAFSQLNEAMKHSSQKVICFFDEFPWMAVKKSQLITSLDYYWNRHWVDNPRLNIIVCGSAASWIIENILNNRGGLHNRVTKRIPLEPFSLSETRLFLHKRGLHLTNDQILHLAMCIGGIPYYLKGIQPGLSAVQNIQAMCFDKGGLLINEFDNLFASLFAQSTVHDSVVRALAQKRHGVSRKKLETITQYKGGGLTRTLRELEQAGFIQKFIPWGQKKQTYYKLIDEYSLFYLNWMQSPRASGLNINEHWMAQAQSSAWQAWSGLAFESICFKHLNQLQKALNIPNGATASTWQYHSKKDASIPGAQIDLLFDRPDGVINVCEIKYVEKPFIINQSYAGTLKQKLEVYRKVTGTKKQLCLSMITTHGLEKSTYLDGLIWSDATAESLFEDF